ncbi:MAG: hypothetical protein LUE21_05350 [Oscillospiraceae bacterium]|nr:hypothetical protein [Oscillospiraceae bacterium]
MPIDRDLIRSQLNELSASGGGSLVKRTVKSQINSNSYVLFVGLGGMGCKSVNAIKRIYTQEFMPTPQVKFVAVDTDQGALNEVNVTHGGYISADETFPLYSPEAAHLLIQRPPVVEQWLSRDVPAVNIRNDGAQQTRAIGRVMLCGTNKYEALRAMLSGLIDKLSGPAHNPVTVVLVAGISGGTGSGTFIDVGYMIRMLLTEKSNDQHISSDFYGVFYTPDVQHSIPEIAGDESKWSNLQRNGYAAMKELDYFVNLGSQRAGTESTYSITLPNGSTYKTSEPILTPNKVFMVSASAGISQCEDIINMTASSLLNMFQTGTAADANNASQSVLSTLSNVIATRDSWVTQHVGAPGNNLALDPCGIKNCPFPAFMNYNFATFGYRSIYFPRNEMVAYCANKAFTMVYDVWKRAFSFDQKFIDNAAAACGIGSLDAIYKGVCQTVNFDPAALRIKPEEDSYPTRRGTAVLGRMAGLDKTISAATAKAQRRLNALNLNATVADAILTTVKSNVESPVFLRNYGPYGGLVLLNGNEGAGIHGFIGHIALLSARLRQEIANKQEALANAQNQVKLARDTLARDTSPHDDEIEVFITACQNYSEAYFEEAFYRLYMGAVLQSIGARLNAYNNETFDIYVPVIDAIKDILNQDAAAFAEGTLHHQGGRTVYELNAYDLNNALTMNHQFESIFDGYADLNMANQVATDFVNSLFMNPDSRARWKDFMGNPAALADEIRRLFSGITAPLISNMLEKFIVVVYGSPDSIADATEHRTAITVADVNRIWNNNDLRTNALHSAAQNIVNTLAESLMISFSIPDNATNSFSRSCSVRLLAETPNLNAAITQVLQGTYGDNVGIYTVGDGTTCEYKTVITMSMSCSCFALPPIRNMSKYAAEYYGSEIGVASSVGRHLDERTEMWQDYLPELFGVDAEEYFLNMWHNDAVQVPDDRRKRNEDHTVKNTGREQYARIREAVDYGIEHGYIFLDTAQKYQLLVLSDRSDAFIGQIESTLIDMRVVNPGATWLDALRKIEEDLHFSKHKLVALDARFETGGLKDRQHLSPDNSFELKNVYRLVRADMGSAHRVIEMREFFEEKDFFYNMDNMSACGEVAKLFIQAYKYGLLTHSEKQGWICTYSDSPYDAPIPFFSDTKRMIPGFDDAFQWYLVFSAFSRIAGDEKVAEGIRAFTSAAEEVGTEPPASCAHILKEMKDALNLPVFRARDLTARDNELKRFYANSNYKEYYSFPKKYTGPETLIFNLKQFISCLEELDRFLGL